MRLPLVFRYRPEPTTFVSEVPIDQAIAQLRMRTQRLKVRLRNRPGVAGMVTERGVRLQRLRGFDGNVFKPFFIGRFVVVEGVTTLQGVFTMLWLVQLTMGTWFALSAIAMVLASYVSWTQARWSAAPLAAAGFLVFGAGLLAMGKKLCRDDPAYLSTFIEAALVKSQEPVGGPPVVASGHRGLVNNEPVDRLVAELASTPDEALLNELFRQLDKCAEEVRWFVDKDYASAALVDAACSTRSAARRQKLLQHAMYRARDYASFATSGGEGMARMREVERIEALLSDRR